MPAIFTTDVLIVGAGPAGTTLAIDLVRRGVAVRIIDKEPAAFDGSRAKGIQPRTLEVFEDLGVLPEILGRGSPYPKMGMHLGPMTIPWRMIEKGKRGPDVPYPDTWLIPQNSTIEALHNRLKAMGTDIELGTELITFTPDATGVSAQVSTAGDTAAITARYIIGADGGSSRVRKVAGIEFIGTTDESDRMLIVDAAVDGGLPRKYWHIWPSLGGRFAAACPLPQSELFQWMIRLAPNENPPTTADEINNRVHLATGSKKLTLRNIQWHSVFRPNIRLAETYRSGPVFLIGDAAHVHTPAGAQGLNTGVGDAYNLGWKIAQVLAGASDELLDTYEAERRPIAANVLGMSTKKYEGLGTLDPKSARRGNDEKQLGLSYFGGPLAPACAEKTSTLRVGDRAPDAILHTDREHRVRLFDAYAGPHFTAIGHGPTASEAVRALPWPDTGAALRRIVVSDPSSDFARIYGLTEDTLLLIRPDGYIGHIATGDNARTTRLFPAVAGSSLPQCPQSHSERAECRCRTR